MYKTILVAKDIENGRRIVDRLEKDGWRMDAVFWFHSEENDRWKLVIVSPDVAAQGPLKLYSRIQTMLSEMANDPKDPLDFPLNQIMLVTSHSLLYQTVKRGVGLRIVTGGPLRDGVAEDVYVYKMN
jgi:hypothetical protein